MHQKIIAIEKIVCFADIPMQHAMSWGWGEVMGKHQVWSEGIGIEGKYGPGPLWWFLWERTSEVGNVGLELAGGNNFRVLDGQGTVLYCLVP